ncbi:putative phosphorylethanolamine transferase [Scheffersomyces amazonensis]|uniref:putative phosphorylethanolamine transferase n=1 Tax=Scheffersomyces amazonensis TaxID=1078765 RepID=UPI00315DB284
MFARPEGIENCRIWIDGCFDFAHHGHAGAMLQARQLGKELYVGVHSDEEILLNKGPTVMKLDERITAVEACKWSTKAIGDAPYVTDPNFMDKFDCKYVVHGDDITTDANGEDCYQIVKDLGRFVVVKRTPNISTTDLVGRMLLMSKNHHFKSILSIDQSSKNPLLNEENIEKFKIYASDSTGLQSGSGVYYYYGDEKLNTLVEPSSRIADINEIYYVDGGFDLFHPGHIEILNLIRKDAEASTNKVKIVVGIHDDSTINKVEGLNYPIMNILERSLCTLQCRYVDSTVLGVPYEPTTEFLNKLPGKVTRVYHGPTQTEGQNQYKYVPKELYHKVKGHKYDFMNTEFIVNRVLSNKAAYEERQKRKGWKAEIENKLKEDESSKA